MRQSGILAAAGLYALEHNFARMEDDHRRAEILADELREVPGLLVNRPLTNIVTVEIQAGHPVLIRHDNGGRSPLELLREANVLVTGARHRLRLVTHLGVDDDDVDAAAAAFSAIFGA